MRGSRMILAAAAAVIAWFALWSLVPPPQSARAQLAGSQTWAGTAGGTSTALTLSIHNVVALNDLLGVEIKFLPSGNAIGPTTLTINLDGGSTLGPTSILRPTSNSGLGLQPPSGSELVTGVLAKIVYDGTEFVITSAVDMTPVGQAIDLRGNSSTAPLGYMLEDGSCYSKTTYPALFSIIGGLYDNSGLAPPVSCSGTQFNVPFSNGTLTAAIDSQGVNGAANRITSGGSGCGANTFVLCGSQNQTLSASQIPSITSSVTQSITVSTSAFIAANASGVSSTSAQGGSSFTAPSTPSASWSAIQSLSGNNTINVTSNNTSGSAHPILNPILTAWRAIKA